MKQYKVVVEFLAKDSNGKDVIGRRESKVWAKGVCEAVDQYLDTLKGNVKGEMDVRYIDVRGVDNEKDRTK